MTLVLDPETEARLTAMAEASGKDKNTFGIAALRAGLELAAEEERQRHAELHGPAHPFDLEAMRLKYGHPPNRTFDEIEAAADAALANMTPEQRTEAKRLGIL